MLKILFVISILNVLTMITNSITKDLQDLILMTRILIDLSFLMMILVIKTIITINNNNNNNHKLLKNNNFRYLKLVDRYKSSTKTQTSLLNKIKINLVSKTQTSIIITTKIRLNLTIMNLNDDLLLKHINIMSKIKKRAIER